MAILKEANQKTSVNRQPGEEEHILHDMNEAPKKSSMKKYLLLGVIIVGLGVLTGYVIPKGSGANSLSLTSQGGSTNSGQKIYGSSDTKLFKDMAEGTLKEGGLEGEGTHQLIRPGGESQTVYIKSTVLDLDQFNGKKIRVWGQTNAAQTAGWLMDVGRVEILN